MSQPSSTAVTPEEPALETVVDVEGSDHTALPSAGSGTADLLRPMEVPAEPSSNCLYPDLLPLATLFIGKQIHVVYFFSGVQRKGDVKTFLQMFTKAMNISLVMHEVDLLQGPSHDLSILQSQDEWLQKLCNFNIVLCTPPCSNFSRVVWANRNGPHPVRSARFPAGFPWLSAVDRAKADFHNNLISFLWRVMAKIEDIKGNCHSVGFAEHPEDLGRVL